MISQKPLPDSQETASTTVLVVAGDVLLRSNMAEYLRLKSYRVLEAGDIAQARRVLSADLRIQLVLADGDVPGDKSGVGLCRFLQTHHPGVPILILRNGHERGDINGPPFLSKPFRFEKLLAVAQTLLLLQSGDQQTDIQQMGAQQKAASGWAPSGWAASGKAVGGKAI